MLFPQHSSILGIAFITIGATPIIHAAFLRAEAEEHLSPIILDGESIDICPHIDMKAADGSIVVGWLASQTDMLSEDWEVID